MEITVNLYCGMEKIAGASHILVEFKDEVTIGGLLNKLIDSYGEEMKTELVDLNINEFASSLIIHNGESMQLVPNLEKKLEDGDEISLITFCAGG